MDLFAAELVALFARNLHLKGQIEFPFYQGSSDVINIKNDSIAWYFYPKRDSTIIVYMSKNLTTYKVFDRSNRLLVIGDLGGERYVDYVERFGK